MDAGPDETGLGHGSSSPSGPRRLCIGVIQLALLGVVLVVAAEATARLDDYVHRGVAFSAVPDLTYDLIIRDSIGTRGRPNGSFQKWHLNSAGFRSPENVLDRRAGCVRVMALGSSETFGVAGESPGKEFPAQLADSLGGAGCYQVMNAAIVGIAVPGMIQLWDSWAYRFEPDVVVILANPIFYLADNAPAYASRHVGPPDPPAPWWTPRLLGRAHDMIHYPDFIQRKRVQRQLRQRVEGKPPNWIFRTVPEDRLQRYRGDLDSLLVTIRARGARPVLVAHPIRFGEQLDDTERPFLEALRIFSPRALPNVMLEFESRAATEVRQLASRRDVPVVDLPPRMNGHPSLFSDAVHYSDLGASVVAGEVGRLIRAMAPATSIHGRSTR